MPEAPMGRRELRPDGLPAQSGREALIPLHKQVAPAGPDRARSGHARDRRVPAADVRRRPPAGPPTAARPSPEARSAAIVTAALVAGLVAGYGIAVPVGAVATLLVTLTA